MADKQLMVDSGILIDYFRKTNKANSKLATHFRDYNHLYISSVTEFEVINGATQVTFGAQGWHVKKIYRFGF